MRVAYSGSGRLATAIGGNALLSCVPRPGCLSRDNNALEMVPLRPSPTEPGPPYGLFHEGGPTTPSGQLPELDVPLAASGALVDVPAKARIRWAGLTVTASDGKIPDLVVLHGPDSGWFPIRLGAPAKAESPNIRIQQAYADVTAIVQGDGGGFWWLAGAAAQLPTGSSQYAGWALAVVYESPGSAMTEAAAYTGPVAVEGPAKVAVKVSGASVTAAYSVWDGDKILHGDRLTIGGRSMGTDGNFAQGVTPSATALICAAHREGCVWRTPGADVGQYAAKTGKSSTVTVEPGRDPLGLGLLLIAQTASR
jgi:hypothetical protein